MFVLTVLASKCLYVFTALFFIVTTYSFTERKFLTKIFNFF